MKLKRTLCLILAAVCMLGCFATTASAITNSGIQVTVNGIAVPFSDDAGYPMSTPTAAPWSPCGPLVRPWA